MSATGGPGGEPSEEELQAAYEAQLKQLRVEHILLDNVVALINLAMRRTGLAPGTEGERDPGQVKLAIEAVRALMPQLEQVAPEEISQIRGALSQLQLAYVRIGGQTPAGEGSPGAEAPAAGAPAGAPAGAAAGAPPSAGPGPAQTPGASPEDPSGAGPAQRSGRLWVPGQ